jgi:hypothetical protein
VHAGEGLGEIVCFGRVRDAGGEVAQVGEIGGAGGAGEEVALDAVAVGDGEFVDVVRGEERLEGAVGHG